MLSSVKCCRLSDAVVCLRRSRRLNRALVRHIISPPHTKRASVSVVSARCLLLLSVLVVTASAHCCCQCPSLLPVSVEEKKKKKEKKNFGRFRTFHFSHI